MYNMTGITALAGLNIYSVIGLLIAATILFHVTSKEETVLLAIAAVVIVYMIKG